MGYTEDNISSIKELTKSFKKFRADGKKPKTLMEMGFKPKKERLHVFII